jgi:threonyl-tRNA synthetase
MFTINVEKEQWALKPMNCPGHCLIFDSRDRSYRELPIRMAEFGVIHRNEASGALTGLMRVRRFVQDDAHIFCLPSQVHFQCLSGLEKKICWRWHKVEDEIAALFDFMQHTYGLFGLDFHLELSTRPDSFLGNTETWNQAEEVCIPLFHRLSLILWIACPAATQEGPWKTLSG